MRTVRQAALALAMAVLYGSRLINADPSSPVKTKKRSDIDSQPPNAAKRTRRSSRLNSEQKPNSSENDDLKANDCGINDKEVESEAPTTYAEIMNMTTEEQALTALLGMIDPKAAQMASILGCYFSKAESELDECCNKLFRASVKLILGGYGRDYSSAFARSDAEFQTALNQLGRLIEKNPGGWKANPGYVPTGDEDGAMIANYATDKDWERKEKLKELKEMFGEFNCTLPSSSCLNVWLKTVPKLLAMNTKGECDITKILLYVIDMIPAAFTIDPKSPIRTQLYEDKLDQFCNDFKCTREDMYAPFVAKVLYASVKHYLKHQKPLAGMSITLQSAKVFNVDESAIRINKFSLIFNFIFRGMHGELLVTMHGARLKKWSVERIKEVEACILNYFRKYISAIKIPPGAKTDFLLRYILNKKMTKDSLSKEELEEWDEACREVKVRGGNGCRDKKKGIFDPTKGDHTLLLSPRERSRAIPSRQRMPR